LNFTPDVQSSGGVRVNLRLAVAFSLAVWAWLGVLISWLVH
jgi:hypothetical protein